MKHKRNTKEKISFIDRIAVAFLSGVFGFFSGVVVWFLLAAAYEFEGQYILSSFKLVIGFAGIMAVSGFFMLENFIANFFGHLWHAIFNHLRH